MFVANKRQISESQVLAGHYRRIYERRMNANALNERLTAGLVGNQAVAAEMDPSLWADIDRETRHMTLPEGGMPVLLTDLMGLVKNVHIGDIASFFRRFGGDMEAQTSLDGQHQKPLDAGAYDYEGVLVPIHTSQYGIQWRQLEGMRKVGYDVVADNQIASTYAVRRKVLDNFLNGQPGLQYRGVQSSGIRNNPNAIAVDLDTGPLAFDFTDQTETFDAIRAALVALVDVLHGPDNSADGDVTLYVSPEVWSNLQRTGATQGNLQSFAEVLGAIPGIDKIERLGGQVGLSGNEIVGIIRRAEYIRPVVGMPINTVPIDRKTPMDDYHFLTWTATGLQIKSDLDGRSGVFHAAGG